MINAYDLFPDPEERDYVKRSVDEVNGQIVSITTKEVSNVVKPKTGAQNQRRERSPKEKCILKTNVPGFNAYAGRKGKGNCLTFRTIEKHVQQ